MTVHYKVKRWKHTHPIEPICVPGLDQALEASRQATRDGYKSEIHATFEEDPDEICPPKAPAPAPATVHASKKARR